MSILFRTLAAGALTLVLSAAAAAQSVDEGKARSLPWSGYWWPHTEGRMLGVLAKYDQITGSQAQGWERKTHPPGGGADRGWHGYCHAWSASCVLEKEPSASRQAAGPGGRMVELTVGDQKGLMAMMHASDVPNLFVGRRSETDNPNAPEYQDLSPDQLWRLMKLYIQQKGVPLIMDLDPGRAVWNYPVYSYRIDYRPIGGGKFQGNMVLHYADDVVPPSFQGISPGKRELQFTFRMREGAVVSGSGEWINASVKTHPDFAWYPHSARPENPNIEVAKVRRLIGSQAAMRGETEFPPVVITDPDNPPQPPNVPDRRPPKLDGSGPAPQTVVSPTGLATVLTMRPPAPVPNGGGPKPPPNPMNPNVPPVVGVKSSFFFDITVDKFDGGKYVIGESVYIKGVSEKAGYMYLFHIDPNGQTRLLFPLSGQDNRIPADKRFTVGGPNDQVKFTCNGPPGVHRIRGIVTTKPLAFTGLDFGNVAQFDTPTQTPVQNGGQAPPAQNPPADAQNPPAGQAPPPPAPAAPEVGVAAPAKGVTRGIPFEMDPSQKSQVEKILVDAGPTGNQKPEQVEQFTGAKPDQVLGEFGQDEVAFYVGRPVGKPMPMQNPPPAPKPDAPAPKPDVPAKPGSPPPG